MIPPVVFYILGAALAVWGAVRLNMARRPKIRGRVAHVVFGALYIVMGLFLILSTAHVIPMPRLGGRARPDFEVVEVRPTFQPIPRPPGSQPASAPASQPGRAAASRPAGAGAAAPAR